MGFFDSFKRADVGEAVAAPPASAAFHADEKTNAPVKADSLPSDMEKGHGDSGSSAHHEYEPAAPIDATDVAPVVVSERGARLVTADSGLKRSLQNRHIQVRSRRAALAGTPPLC